MGAHGVHMAPISMGDHVGCLTIVMHFRESVGSRTTWLTHGPPHGPQMDPTHGQLHRMAQTRANSWTPHTAAAVQEDMSALKSTWPLASAQCWERSHMAHTWAPHGCPMHMLGKVPHGPHMDPPCTCREWCHIGSTWPPRRITARPSPRNQSTPHPFPHHCPRRGQSHLIPTWEINMDTLLPPPVIHGHPHGPQVAPVRWAQFIVAPRGAEPHGPHMGNHMGDPLSHR